jgi:hypothetical protein
MSRFFAGSVVACLVLVAGFAYPQGAATPAGHYLFVWAGDAEKKGNDFLLVIDAGLNSPNRGRAVSALETDQVTVRPHHTEYTMPASGMLFANDHDAGRSFIFDVRDPLKPAVASSFGELAGFAHPHSFLRLPNGHVLATFQHDVASMKHGTSGRSGGLVELDDRGAVIRSRSNADPAFPQALLMPYSLVVLPEIDRVLSTNSSMHDPDLFSGTTFQVWRLSDLQLLTTAYLHVGENRYAHISPEEPRLGPDGAVYVQTLSCGLERISGIGGRSPVSKLVHTFPGNWCGVPTIVGRWFVQPVPAIHGFVVLDIKDGAHPVEVSRLSISAGFSPHWTAWDEAAGRIVAPPNSVDDNRLYLLALDTKSGALTVDADFRDTDGEVGFSFARRTWPHGWRGVGRPHGAVFSRE